jgi:predicted N-acetyltransferase YhbS
LPEGIEIRRVASELDVRRLSEMQEAVFGGDFADEMTAALLRRLGFADGMELWVAEAEDEVVASGRLEPVPGTRFAGIWGGATVPGWRGRGIYRALTAARARSALRLGKSLVHSDSTEDSRPILERAGLVKVSTTTPYLWRADG